MAQTTFRLTRTFRAMSQTLMPPVQSNDYPSILYAEWGRHDRLIKFTNARIQQGIEKPSYYCGVDGNLRNGDQEKTGSILPQVVPDPSYRRHLNSHLRTEM